MLFQGLSVIAGTILNNLLDYAETGFRTEITQFKSAADAMFPA
jgi:hypothetical protein